MAKLDVIEETKLKWPDGLERTRIKERVGQGRWKEGWAVTRQKVPRRLVQERCG